MYGYQARVHKDLLSGHSIQKLVQQFVHLQQPFAIQQHLVAFHGEKSPILQPLNRLGEFFGGFDAEFFLEIRAAHAAQLELQNEFADQPFLGRRRQRPEDGQFPAIHALHIRIEVGVVLVMHAVDVAEARHPDGQQIRALPQPVAIDELRALGIFDRGVGAAHSVAGLFKFRKSVIHPVALRFPIRYGRDEDGAGVSLWFCHR